MVNINGKMKRWGVRTFRWNKKMYYEVSRSEGLFVIRVKNNVRGQAHRTEQKEVYAFYYEDFKNPETMQAWLGLALKQSDFFPARTIKELVEKIPIRLLRSFKFQVDENGPTKPVTVVLLDVHMDRIKGASQSGPTAAAKKEKISFGDRVDEELELAKPETELIDKWLMQRLNGLLLGSAAEEPFVETEPRGLYRVEPALDIKKSDGRGLAEDEECSICFDRVCDGERPVATTPCSHVFHWECLTEWLPMNGACPICRTYCTTII